MKCIGRTKSSNFCSRCIRPARFLFCWQHIWQPLLALVFIMAFLATLSAVSGFSIRDLIGIGSPTTPVPTGTDGISLEQPQTHNPNPQGLSAEAIKYLTILKSPNNPDEVYAAVHYFINNPTEEAFEPLSQIADFEQMESSYIFATLDAIKAIGLIKIDEARDLLFHRALTTVWGGHRDLYLKALYGFNDPCMVEPLISIFKDRNPGVTSSAVVLARKLGDPRLASYVKEHFDKTIFESSYLGSREICRDTIIELQTKAIHEQHGLKMNLPVSLDMLMSNRKFAQFREESDPKTRAVDLTYLKQTKRLTQEESAILAIDGLLSSDTLIRWVSTELAASLEPQLVRQQLRMAMEVEKVPFMHAVLVDAFSHDWQTTDCELVVQKLREYCLTNKYRLMDSVSSGVILVRHLVRHQYTEAASEIELFASTIESLSDESLYYHKDYVEDIRRALTVLLKESDSTLP